MTIRHVYALIIDCPANYSAIPKILEDALEQVVDDCAVNSVQLVVVVPTQDDERVPRLALDEPA